eukprot:GFKZ01014442.1.p1 GENE.GFKZ01014442.1~~GFKZ01014442.1.p1  ORF type:complete len:954 (+),score=131.96 GFKZ01014442.1:42-2864(+)
MATPPKTRSEFEAAASQILSRLNRTGAVDRLRKAVEARITGDARRADMVNNNITTCLQDHAPKTSDKPDPKALVKSARQQVLTPALEDDIRQDIQNAVDQLPMRQLFDAEVEKLGQSPNEEKQVDTKKVRAMERKAFLARFIKPMNEPKQNRPPERKAARYPGSSSTAQSRALASAQATGAGDTNAQPVEKKHRRMAEVPVRRETLSPSGKQRRAIEKRSSDGARIPPSAAKPPAGPHKAEVRSVAESTAANDHGIPRRAEEQRSKAGQQPLEVHAVSKCGGDGERTPSVESGEKKPVDGSADKISASVAPGRDGEEVGNSDRAKDDSEKPSSAEELRPREGNTDPPVTSRTSPAEDNSRGEARTPPRSHVEPVDTIVPGEPIVSSGEGPLSGGEAVLDEKKPPDGQGNTAEPASLENEKVGNFMGDGATAEGNPVELELSWRRPPSKHDEPYMKVLVEVKRPRGRPGEYDIFRVPIELPWRDDSVSSYKEDVGVGDRTCHSSAEVIAESPKKSLKRRDNTNKVSPRSSGNSSSSIEERSPTGCTGGETDRVPARVNTRDRPRGRRGGRQGGRLRGHPRARPRRLSPRVGSSEAVEENPRAAKGVRRSPRSSLRSRGAENQSEIFSEPLDETGHRDGTGEREIDSATRAGATTNAARNERQQTRGNSALSTSGQLEQSRNDEAGPSKKRRRGGELESSYDFGEQQKVLRALRNLEKEAHAYPFLLPVDPKDEGCENYYNEISCPMSISTITERLESSTPTHGHYARVEDVMKDVELIWSNCRDFNGSYDPVVKDADKCANALEIFLENEGLQRGIGGRSKRRRTCETFLNDSSEEGGSYRGDLGDEAGVRTSNSAINVLERQAEMARENKENDGHLVGEDVVVFTTDGSKKSWRKLDILSYNPESRSYTVRCVRSGKTTRNVRFGVFTEYSVMRIAGKPL